MDLVLRFTSNRNDSKGMYPLTINSIVSWKFITCSWIILKWCFSIIISFSLLGLVSLGEEEARAILMKIAHNLLLVYFFVHKYNWDQKHFSFQQAQICSFAPLNSRLAMHNSLWYFVICLSVLPGSLIRIFKMLIMQPFKHTKISIADNANGGLQKHPLE